MTAFLIVLIIFFAIWGWQKLSASAKESERKKNTKTNVKLEQEIRKKYYDETGKVLDQVRPDVKSVYQFLVDYINKCGLPYLPFAYSPEQRETTYKKEKERSDSIEEVSDEVHLIVYAILSTVSYRNYPKILKMSDAERTKYLICNAVMKEFAELEKVAAPKKKPSTKSKTGEETK